MHRDDVRVLQHLQDAELAVYAVGVQVDFLYREGLVAANVVRLEDAPESALADLFDETVVFILVVNLDVLLVDQFALHAPRAQVPFFRRLLFHAAQILVFVEGYVLTLHCLLYFFCLRQTVRS